MEQNTTTTTSLFELQIDPIAGGYLRDSAKWAKFLAIVGFVFCGFIVLIGLFAGSALSSAMSIMGGGRMAYGGGVVTFFYLCFAVLFFFPCLFLFNYASKAQAALRGNDQDTLVASLKNLRAYFRFVGILTIVCLGLWLLSLLMVMLAFSSSHI